MPPIQVAKDDVLAAVVRLRRVGNAAGLHRLERFQPELAELLMETTSDLHRRLSRTRLPPLVVRRFTRRAEDLGITLVDAVLIAQVRHVQQQHRFVIPPLA